MMRVWTCVLSLSLGVVVGAGCDGDDDGADDGSDGNADASAPAADGGVADATPGCARTPSPDDGPRKVVVALPYTAAGVQAKTYKVLDLTADGKLGLTGPTFEMGRAFAGEIAFTPDGEVGLVAQDDGSLGVFRFDAGGAVVVVHASFTGAFYASRVVMDPSGERAWVVDTSWRENGGGVYGVRIACDGTLTDEGLHVAARLPSALAFLPGGRAVLAATDALDSATDEDIHVLDWATSARLGSVNGFTMNDAIVGGAAVVEVANGRYFVVGDLNELGPLVDRVTIARIENDGTLGVVDTLLAIDDPHAIVASPHGDLALVVSGYGNALYIVDYNPVAGQPWSLFGEVEYSGLKPQLPGSAVSIRRGTLAGRVFIGEVLGVRQVDLKGGLVATDLGLTALGTESDATVGAIGVQP